MSNIFVQKLKKIMSGINKFVNGFVPLFYVFLGAFVLCCVYFKLDPKFYHFGLKHKLIIYVIKMATLSSPALTILGVGIAMYSMPKKEKTFDKIENTQNTVKSSRKKTDSIQDRYFYILTASIIVLLSLLWRS